MEEQKQKTRKEIYNYVHLCMAIDDVTVQVASIVLKMGTNANKSNELEQSDDSKTIANDNSKLNGQSKMRNVNRCDSIQIKK